ncbi:MAG: transposase [Candidatus Nanoarchaeia archaeon]
MVLDDFRLVGIVDLIGVLDLDWIRFFVRRKYRTRGRRAFDPVVMFKALLVGYFKNLDYRGLSLFLKKNPQVAFSCDFNGINPNFSSFSRFRKRLGYKMIKKIFIKIVYELY